MFRYKAKWIVNWNSSTDVFYERKNTQRTLSENKDCILIGCVECECFNIEDWYKKEIFAQIELLDKKELIEYLVSDKKL